MPRLRRHGDSSTLQSPGPLAQLSDDLDHSSGVSTRSRCLSEDDVLSLCEGRVKRDSLARIDEHIDQCDNCRQWVVEMLGFAEVEFAEVDPETLHPTILRSGSIIADRFRIVRFIKRGGMGEVYEAFDQMLEAPVALKTIISTACDSPKAIRKLKAEVQLARSIRHPNVCSVFDFWEHRDGDDDRSPVFFFTMEFIAGETLGQRLRHQRLEHAEARRLARLQLLGLRAAHVSGVVHRDFKSDNVMLRSGGREGADLVVMDFGLARLVQNGGGTLSNDSEQFAGSVAYMAPEQVEGRKHIGTEADVFAFGVVFFEMLTGQLPYSGDSPWTIATKRLTERPPPPSRLASGVSPALDAFVLKCLSREPSDRFKDAQAALEAFDALARSSTRRPRLGKAAAAIAVAFMFVALAGALWSQREPASVRSRADSRPATPASTEPVRAAAALQPQTPVAPLPQLPVAPAVPPEPMLPAGKTASPASAGSAPPSAADAKPPAAGAKPSAAGRSATAAGDMARSAAGAKADVAASSSAAAEPQASPAAGVAAAAPLEGVSDEAGAAAAAESPRRKPGAPPRLRTFE